MASPPAPRPGSKPSAAAAPSAAGVPAVPVVPISIPAENVFNPKSFSAPRPNRDDIRAVFGDDTLWKQFFEPHGYFKFKKGITEEMIREVYADPRVITRKDVHKLGIKDYAKFLLVKPVLTNLSVKRTVNVIDLNS